MKIIKKNRMSYEDRIKKVVRKEYKKHVCVSRWCQWKRASYKNIGEFMLSML